jgi:predicted TIM-barrel fold metal-dependent hydrolase
MFLKRLHTDEFDALRYREVDLRVIAQTAERVKAGADRAGLPPSSVAKSRLGTAAGLRAINEEAGADFYQVPDDAARDEATADEVFRGRLPVIDVQTHFMAPHAFSQLDEAYWKQVFGPIKPDWWTGLDELTSRNLAEYIQTVFLESETACAILTSGPGYDTRTPLHNHEITATRALVEALGGTGRLLNHVIVNAQLPGDIEAMEAWRDELRPVGWKVYTPGHVVDGEWVDGYMLDDEEHGLPFLERARDLGVRLVCSHKGVSQLAQNGSPRDIGPVAKLFPDLDFVIYHSGYELPHPGIPLEGPYEPSTAHIGINRLLSSLEENGIGPGQNVYAELGGTWFSLVRRPVEAAHVLGKLVKHMGADNIIWGSDTIWYGGVQPIIDAFRTFQIPDEICERYGYEPLTPEIKEKILSANASRVYGIDLDLLAKRVATDDLAWATQLVEDYRRSGFEALL